jgi:uncharacterized protein involved in exopolysaccharide biosynthesis
VSETIIESIETAASPPPAAQSEIPTASGFGDPFIEIGEMLDAARRRWRLMGGIFAAVVLATSAFTCAQPEMYESESLLLMTLGRELVYRPEVGDSGLIASSNRDDRDINSEIQILNSYETIERVVAEMGVETLYPELMDDETDPRILLHRGVLKFRENLKGSVIEDTDVIRVRYLHTDPVIAAMGLKLTVDQFIRKHLEAFGQTKVVHVLEAKVDEYGQQLASAEAALQTFESAYPLFYISDPRALLLQQRGELSKRLSDVQNEIDSLRHKRLLDLPEMFAAEEALLKLQLDENLSEAKTQKQLEQARKRIALAEDFRTRMRAEFEAQEAATRTDLDARRTTILAEIAKLEQQISSLPPLLVEHRKLTWARDAAAKRYQLYFDGLEESRLSVEMDKQQIASISVIQAPREPLEPSHPDPSTNLAVGVFAGAGLASLSAFLLERRPRRRGTERPEVVRSPSAPRAV